nr:hypothetical protein [Aeromonas caviae]
MKPVVFERPARHPGEVRQSIAALRRWPTSTSSGGHLFGTPLQQVAAEDCPRHRCSHPAAGADGPDSGGRQCEEIGSRIGVSRTTARRYLEFLVGSNWRARARIWHRRAAGAALRKP